jgi:hypothetical protein
MSCPLRGCEILFLDDLFFAPYSRGAGVVKKTFYCLGYQGARTGLAFLKMVNSR